MKSGSLWITHLSYELSKRVYSEISAWSSADRRHVGDQWIRATDSIGANIVEGHGRKHGGDSLRFYSIAAGSLEESMYWLRIARDRGLVDEPTSRTLFALLTRLSRGLTNFIRKAEKRTTER